MAITKAQLVEWESAKDNLDHYKELEMKLRKRIVSSLTGTDAKAIAKTTIGNIDVVATSKVTTSIEDKDELLDDRDGMSPEVQGCFPMKVSFSAAEYKKLDESDKREVDYYLIEKPAAPTLTIKHKK